MNFLAHFRSRCGWLIALALGANLFLSSCALLQRIANRDNPENGSNRHNSVSLGDYRMHSDSQVYVAVFRDGKLLTEEDLTVDSTGNLRVMGIGDVSVEGMNALQAAKKVEYLARSSGQNHLRGRRVHFKAIDQKAVVHVSGHVKQPGPVTYHPKLTVAEAIRVAGGGTPDANTSAVSLTTAGRRKIATSLEQRLLEEGDVIHVPRRLQQP